jgi:hypothetical protein
MFGNVYLLNHAELVEGPLINTTNLVKRPKAESISKIAK